MKLSVLLILFAVLPVVAQKADNWDFLSDPSVFRDVHGMLPAYLKSKASRFLTSGSRRSPIFRRRRT